MNNTHDTFSFSGRIRSGTHALHGIIEMLKSQHNAWIHLTATVCVIVAGAVLGVSATQWCLLVLVITTVWVAEGLNTAFEFLCDVASPEFHPLVARAKDVAAGAVLISAIGSVAIALLILGPYIFNLVHSV